MFKVNVWSRLFSYIIICICIIIAQNRYVLLALALLSLVLSIIFRKTSSIIFSILSMLMCAIYFGYPFLSIFMKLYLLVLYYILMKECLSPEEKRYLYEKDAYLLKGRKGSRYYVKKNYYKDIMNKNLDLYEDMHGYFKKEKLLKEEAIEKSKQELNEIYLFNKLRYFKYYPGKNCVNKSNWKLADFILIILSICILFLTIIVR